VAGEADSSSEHPAPAPQTVTCQLAMGARAGQAGSFDALHARLSPAIMAWARMPMHRHLHDGMDPDDFIQEVWIRATGSFSSFDPERGSFRRWIFMIAKNLSIDQLRRYSRAKARGAPAARGGSSMHELGHKAAGDPSTWLQVARSEAFGMFIARVTSLPRDEQLLLVHCGLEELPVAQVAQRLEISEAAALKRWQRLRARLIDQGLPDGIID
jgi:RNA polymerase sigma factor (sigma-70 family)